AKSGRNGKTSQGLLLRYRNRLLIRLTNLFVLITALRFRGAVFLIKNPHKNALKRHKNHMDNIALLC
ncbi:MAG: hypothetical protein WAS06_06600, partial [Ruminococcus bromii]